MSGIHPTSSESEQPDVPLIGRTECSAADVLAVLEDLAKHPEELNTLQWAAVVMPWPDVAVVADAAGLAVEVVAAHLNTALQWCLLDHSQQARQVPYHFESDQLFQAVYDTLPEDERARRHLRVAEVLQERESAGQAVDEMLAWHFERAGESALALQYAQLAADQAREVYDNVLAIRLYDHALRLLCEYPALSTPQLRYELLSSRADCYRLTGNRAAQLADLDALVQVVEELGDAERSIAVSIRRAELANQMGDQVEAAQMAEMALSQARGFNRKLAADSLTVLGEATYNLSELERSYDSHAQALQLYRELGNREGEANSLRLLGRAAYRMGRTDETQSFYGQSLAFYRELRDRAGEANVLNALGVTAADFAMARDYFEQSLVIRQSIGDRLGQGTVYNNLALIYWRLGLYERAREHLSQAVQIERESGASTMLTYYLESLGRVYLDLGEYDQAQQVLEEGLALSQEAGDRWVASVYWWGLGCVALAQGQLEPAQRLLHTACDLQTEVGALGELSISQAWLGATYRALGDLDAALRYTTGAVESLRAAGNTGDHAAQDVWWQHYQVLKAVSDSFAHGAITDEAWECLQQAYAVMLAAVVSLSDEGLRRNYLNKVKINRDIVSEWTRQLAIRAPDQLATLPPLQPDPATEAGRLKERLRRVFNVSRQMNELHEAGALHNFVMDQVIELSGAERGFLVILEPGQGMDFKVVRGMPESEIRRAKAQTAYTVLSDVARSKMPILLQDAPDRNEPALQSGEPALNTRSVVCVPLLARAELLGIIYVDNRTIGGQFSETDMDLLTMFANQAATTIENVRLYQETMAWANLLEQRVTERTFELLQANKALSQRARQLEANNRIGQQLTTLLDRDALLEQVVRLIRDQFDYYFVGVWLLADEKNGVVLQAAASRVPVNGSGPGYRIALESEAPVARVARTGDEYLIADTCALVPGRTATHYPDTCTEFILPLTMGNMILGVLDIQGDQDDVFGYDDRLLLQTLGNQIAITIRNAQLYATEMRRRLLAESLEQAGRELVSSLEISEIPGRILDQLAMVVPYARCSIMLKRGEALYIGAQRGFPDDLHAKQVRIPVTQDDPALNPMIETRHPVVFDDVLKVEGWRFVEGLEINHSWLGVPLFSQDRLIGMISMTRPAVGAFSQEDALLASAFAAQASVALENARLYGEVNQAYRTLEKLDRTKSNFIEVTAHELRTPLTVIKGYAQLLGAIPLVKDDPQVRPALDGILSGMERMHDIVNSILDVTKIDSNALRVAKRPVKLLKLIERVVSQVAPALQERQLTVTLQDLEMLPPVPADLDLLSKVFAHLLSNAIKYTPDGGHITIHGWADDTMVEVVVSDTGIGIDPEHQELIFEKFYQMGEVAFHSSGRTKFKGGGPGLGLAIARGVALAHGGNVWVESEGYDEETCPGSHFHVRLPLV
ncbi:MAG: GAF domain-containing protein [Anaerolineae bacterium]|nr:GAF domain-containing protein [Anaerolineae bacterium]